jgi:PadR family transcriptional regulator, regulatory protein PadR
LVSVSAFVIIHNSCRRVFTKRKRFRMRVLAGAFPLFLIFAMFSCNFPKPRLYLTGSFRLPGRAAVRQGLSRKCQSGGHGFSRAETSLERVGFSPWGLVLSSIRFARCVLFPRITPKKAAKVIRFATPYCFPIGAVVVFLLLPHRSTMSDKPDVWQGTLALMVLKTLETLGPLHGYGIARRIEQTSGDLLSVNYGTLYPALLKLELEGYIASEWGVSDNNRKAKYYKLTRAGRKQLETETQEWEQTTAILARFLSAKEQPS